ALISRSSARARIDCRGEPGSPLLGFRALNTGPRVTLSQKKAGVSTLAKFFAYAPINFLYNQKAYVGKPGTPLVVKDHGLNDYGLKFGLRLTGVAFLPPDF